VGKEEVLVLVDSNLARLPERQGYVPSVPSFCHSANDMTIVYSFTTARENYQGLVIIAAS
jgi:hypothetical protein